MLTVLGTATTMAQSLMSVAAGAGGGAGGMQGAAGVGGGAAASSGGGVAAASSNTAPIGPSTSGGSSGSSTRSPSGPSGGGSGPVSYRPPNIPHAAGWLGGAAAALAVQGGQKAVAAGRKMLGGNGQAGTSPTATPRAQGPDSVDEWV